MLADGITGIDLDHCVNEQGVIEEWASTIVKKLASYTEYSPSGTGLHIFVRGHVAKGLKRGIPQPYLPSHEKAAIEMYSNGRYFTVTEKHLTGTPTTIEERQSVLDSLYAEFGEREPVQQKPQLAHMPLLSSAPSLLGLSDQELLQKAETASNGDKFSALFFQGSIAGYPSHSEADQALCNMLAFWTGKDAIQMDRLFRQSALYREKWDANRGGATYGDITIERAIQQCRETYNPLRKQEQTVKEIDRVLHRVAGIQEKLGKNRQTPYKLAPRSIPVEKVLEYLDQIEYGDGLLFAEVFKGQICYDHTGKEWYLWQGHYWELDKTGKIRQLVSGVLGSIYLKAKAELHPQLIECEEQIKQLEKREKELREEGKKFSKEEEKQLEELGKRKSEIKGWMKNLEARADALRTSRRNMSVQLFIQSEMGVTSDMWDSNPWLLATLHGVIDLRTGEFRDGGPADYIRTVCPTEWTGLQISSPRFEQFLEQIFEDKQQERASLIAFLQRLLGYGMTGLSTEAIFPVFYGEEGRNGKDTLLSVLKDVLGPLVGAVSNDVFIAQDRNRTGGSATPHLCDLQGKRLVWGSETKQGDKLNVAQIKLLTGGGEISTRQLHGRQYTFKPSHKLLLMTNYKPHADARDKAFWERACLVEFGMRFVDIPKAKNERKKDSTLVSKLKEEHSGILAWLVRGCLDWQQHGLAIPEFIRVATEEYRNEEDTLGHFIDECCVEELNATIPASRLYETYLNWCKDNQLKPMSGRLFGDDMSKRHEKKRLKVGYVYQGIRVLAPGEEGVGLVYSRNEPYTTYEASPQASSHVINDVSGVGCVGLNQVFIKNTPSNSPFEEKSCQDHTHYTPSQPVTTNEPPSQADSDKVYGYYGSYTNPTSIDTPVDAEEEALQLYCMLRENQEFVQRGNILYREDYYTYDDYFKKLAHDLDSDDPNECDTALSELRRRKHELGL
ncbi:phage/plasmid primase, P4 family [Reticulibacter mediterranei]|nr:phage/plasmid primase, P4 family [Reticulibacter mediterranei]